MYSESVPDRYSDGYAAMERVGDIIYRCENHDINTGHSISATACATTCCTNNFFIF